MACAYRDGIVGHPSQVLTKSMYSVSALALLTGTENEGPSMDMFEYTNQGRLRDMHTVLMMANRGRPIRIIRGHGLQSKYAPRAGLRYDGL